MLHQPLGSNPANEAVRLVDAAAAFVLERKRKREGVGDLVGLRRPKRRRVGHAGL
jgi:hypothetical protein